MFRDVLSFDCASKTLAWFRCAMIVDADRIFRQLESEYATAANSDSRESIAAKYQVIASNVVVPIDYGVVDLGGGALGSEINDITRARAVRWLVDSIAPATPNTIVLVEDQPPFNQSSVPVQHQLMTLYANCDVRVVPPRLKNTIQFTGMEYGGFLVAATSSYNANKQHSVANFIKLVGVFGLKLHITAVKLDDIADAFMQAMTLFGGNKIKSSAQYR